MQTSTPFPNILDGNRELTTASKKWNFNLTKKSSDNDKSLSSPNDGHDSARKG